MRQFTQRARIMPMTTKVTVTSVIQGIVIAGILLFAALASSWFAVVAMAMIGVALMTGWGEVIRVANRASARGVITAVLLAALGAANWRSFATTIFVSALSMIAVFVAEMLRRDTGVDLINQVSGVYLGSFLAISSSLWVYALAGVVGQKIVTCMAVVVAVVAVIESFQVHTVHVLALINALVAALLVAWLVDIPIWSAIAIAVAVTLTYAVTIESRDRPEEPLSSIGRISLLAVPVCALGVIAFVLSLAIV